MRRPSPGRESHRHGPWRLNPPVYMLQLWPSLACGGKTTTGDCCLSTPAILLLAPQSYRFLVLHWPYIQSLVMPCFLDLRSSNGFFAFEGGSAIIFTAAHSIRVG